MSVAKSSLWFTADVVFVVVVVAVRLCVLQPHRSAQTSRPLARKNVTSKKALSNGLVYPTATDISVPLELVTSCESEVYRAIDSHFPKHWKRNEAWTKNETPKF